MQQSIWVFVMDYLAQDIFDSGYDEVYFALQGLARLDSHLKEEWQVDLWKQVVFKTEDLVNTNLQMRAYGLSQLRQIVRLSVQNSTDNAELLQEVEFQVVRIIMGEQQEQGDFEGVDEGNKEAFVRLEVREEVRVHDLVSLGYHLSQGGYSAGDLFV